RALARRTALALELRRVGGPRLPPDFRDALAPLSGGDAAAVRVLDEDTIAGYALLKDVYGRDAVVLRAATPREVYRVGQATLRYALGALLLAGVRCGALLLLLLEPLSFARVARLGGAAGRVAARRGRPSG